MTQHLKAHQPADKRAQLDSSVRTTVDAILGGIEQRGDAAIHEHSQKFDNSNPCSCRLSDVEITACIASPPAHARTQ